VWGVVVAGVEVAGVAEVAEVVAVWVCGHGVLLVWMWLAVGYAAAAWWWWVVCVVVAVAAAVAVVGVWIVHS